MSFYCYCLKEYLGSIYNEGQLPPPLNNIDYFSTLPWELQQMILLQLGENIPKSLGQLERVSSQWKKLVGKIWEDHGEEFLKKRFSPDEIEKATQIIHKFSKIASSKNIYKLLAAKSVFVDLKPSRPQTSSGLIKPTKPVFYRVKNTGSLNISSHLHILSKGAVDKQNIPPGNIAQSGLFQPIGLYFLDLICLTGGGCQAIGEIREFDL